MFKFFLTWKVRYSLVVNFVPYAHFDLGENVKYVEFGER